MTHQQPPPAAGCIRGLVTLNVQHAAAARARRQIAWLAGLDDADVVVLTEVPTGGTAHRRALADCGYACVGGDQVGDYGVIVASRVGRVEAIAVDTGVQAHRCIGAMIRPADGTALGVVGLYVPSRGPRHRRNVDKRAFQTAVTAVLPRIAPTFGGLPVVVAGDLNVVEPEHQPHHAVFGSWEYQFYTAFADHGLTDAFRLHHPDLADHSWFGRAGLGYRFDHLFIDTGHRHVVTGCRYLHACRQNGLSDHAALAAALHLPTT